MKIARTLTTSFLALSLVACSGDDGPDGPETVDFALKFAAAHDGATVDCTSTLTGLGPDGNDALGISDLRFYVSDLQFLDHDGNVLVSTLETNDFQYVSDAGSVVLIDLTSNTEGTCTDSAIAFAEGTARTNDEITGRVQDDVHGVRFSVGLPQAVMKDVIATNTAEDAPSPLAEMFWSWASGYRHFVFNFAVTDSEGTAGEGYVHVGSRDCGGDGARALTDREACGLVNTPSASVSEFNPATDTVLVDLGALLEGVDFVAPIRDTEPPFDVIGQGPGVSCHSSPTQNHCAGVFTNLGLDMTSGVADETQNTVFGRE